MLWFILERCSFLTGNVEQSISLALKEVRVTAIAFKLSSPILFLFFVFTSVTIQKALSASAFECGIVMIHAASFDKLGNRGSSRKFFRVSISRHNSSIGIFKSFPLSDSSNSWGISRHSRARLVRLRDNLSCKKNFRNK